MKQNSKLLELINNGYGVLLNDYSEVLGEGLWKDSDSRILIFDNGISYVFSDKNYINILYEDIIGIKSSMHITRLSKAQSEKICGLIMRFECSSKTYDLLFPMEIYSSLLGYFCDKAQKKNKIQTGFINHDIEL